jgi:glycosyltransferase involved in cell wall biosynthesis
VMLSITIPAYNEEQAIEAIISRCLEARERLIAETDLDEVEVIVISDGSDDATVERARPFAADGRIRLIDYTPNRGYGAALKLGFKESQGELVSFLDADGTCDPLHFVHLVNACLRDHADVACGCRMTPTSKMPPIRRLGNRIFRGLINYLAQTNIRDSASGMRVIRRESLPKIYPLPDGLHFTPAMSCRASLDPDVKLVEIDMDYAERVGESKLSVVMDGLRFLKVILDLGLSYRPFRMFGTISLVLLLLALFLGGTMVYDRVTKPDQTLPYWYIFRMMTALVAASAGLTFGMIGAAADRIALVVQKHQPPPGRIYRAFLTLLRSKTLLVLGVLTAASGVLLNTGTIRSYLTTGSISFDDFWAYAVSGGFLIITGVELMALAVLDRVIMLVAKRQAYFDGKDASEDGL